MSRIERIRRRHSGSTVVKAFFSNWIHTCLWRAAEFEPFQKVNKATQNNSHIAYICWERWTQLDLTWENSDRIWEETWGWHNTLSCSNFVSSSFHPCFCDSQYLQAWNMNADCLPASGGAVFTWRAQHVTPRGEPPNPDGMPMLPQISMWCLDVSW